MGTGSILCSRSPLPSDLYIAIPWMCLWAVGGRRWAAGDGRRAMGGGWWATAVLAQCGEVGSSGLSGETVACEYEKRPGNENNDGLLFNLGTAVLR